ncbi:START-like domain-containing protein [Paludibacter jiangxiensis]|uniref:START-like domain-containing protein n=1 Tax=Paludibacter jiangxiensis TaxID=681398 RepID=A0A161L7Y6_9BACT|nr:START-like domain-containing protein [Paludibacter jiangxiensis]GAT62994.1 hypothetical protein PJIAN_3306 [Paludibacter jiangxiensis]
MTKEKFQIEYVFQNISFNVLWNSISTPMGLADWFADKVDVDGRLYTFAWGDHGQQAELVLLHGGSFIRFHWIDDENEKTYFELKVSVDELTSAVALVITDFAEPDEKHDAILLWNKQIEDLKRSAGI